MRQVKRGVKKKGVEKRGVKKKGVEKEASRKEALGESSVLRWRALLQAPEHLDDERDAVFQGLDLLSPSWINEASHLQLRA